ncbi:MAG: hypothetical protein H0U66_13895 [Gemmatimonadaceae bacterium]|nr:hypothetical protein [Gemmatimonadaceae bacterium]
MGTFVSQLMATERQVVETFRIANAVTPQSAIVPPAWPARTQRQIFKRFTKKRALVATPDGRIWLDETRYFDYIQWRSRGLTIFVVGVVVVTVLAIIYL